MTFQNSSLTNLFTLGHSEGIQKVVASEILKKNTIKNGNLDWGCCIEPMKGY